MEETKKSIIILDANAFISMTNIKSLGVNNKLITTADVIEELKDAKTKAFFDEIPFDIEVKHFDEKSLNFIK
jgi:rRNA maturation endonuclease Nob1